jgi:two-component system, chemotaxis family, response regulator WspF
MLVAIAHDNLDTTRFLRYLLADIGHEVAWTAASGQSAIDKAKHDLPDLILVKLVLPDMTASELIKTLIQDESTTIIVIGSTIKKQPSKVFEAMSAGALDAVNEPSTDEQDSIQNFKRKIKNISNLHRTVNKRQRTPQVVVDKGVPLIAIGSSTGGPAALVTVLSKIKPDIHAVVVIIQHMDDQFSRGMVKWIDEQTDIKVEMAKDNQKAEVATVYIAGTADHLVLKNNCRFIYTPDPVDYPYRPSVDAFFESAVTYWPNKIVGVLLTGMGRDGASGLLSLKNRGMFTIAQDEATCAVYGMPKAAAELNAASKVLPIDEIGDAINKAIK